MGVEWGELGLLQCDDSFLNELYIEDSSGVAVLSNKSDLQQHKSVDWHAQSYCAAVLFRQ